MPSTADEIRRQLAESAHVKQSFSAELVKRIAEFAAESAAALAPAEKSCSSATVGARRAGSTWRLTWWCGCGKTAAACRHWRYPQIHRYSRPRATTTASSRFMLA